MNAPAMTEISASPTFVTPVTSAAMPDSASARMMLLSWFRYTDMSDSTLRPPCCRMSCDGDLAKSLGCAGAPGKGTECGRATAGNDIDASSFSPRGMAGTACTCTCALPTRRPERARWLAALLLRSAVGSWMKSERAVVSEILRRSRGARGPVGTLSAGICTQWHQLSASNTAQHSMCLHRQAGHAQWAAMKSTQTGQSYPHKHTSTHTPP